MFVVLHSHFCQIFFYKYIVMHKMYLEKNIGQKCERNTTNMPEKN